MNIFLISKKHTIYVAEIQNIGANITPQSKPHKVFIRNFNGF